MPKTFLHMACYHNFKNATDFILTKQPWMTTRRDEYGDTPLHIASYALHTTCTACILRHKPDIINYQNNDQQTALHLACNNEVTTNKIPKTLKTLNLLISHGADITITDHVGATPLFYLFNSVYPDHYKYITKELILTKDHHNNTQLHLCAKLLFFDENILKNYVTFLMTHGLSLCSENNNGETPIHLACENENLEIQEGILKIFFSFLPK